DPNQVKRLFQGTTSVDGLADSLYDYLDKMVNNIDGTLTQKVDIYDDTIASIETLITDREKRITAYQASLEARFYYMESYLAELQTQETMLTNFSEQLSALAKQS
ncbi:MAG: flagellar filament capping protein FliD, partial [Nitrosopumilaceae archaeon]|nr:flagellar filament capping protein FliD [Nitrosopumilaceae archaeon]